MILIIVLKAAYAPENRTEAGLDMYNEENTG